MKFTSKSDKIREERSNQGSEALARSILQNLLGLTQPTVDSLMQQLQQTGEDSLMRQNLKLLGLVAHSRLNQILDQVESITPDVNDDLEDDQMDDMFDTVDDIQDTIQLDNEEDELIDGPYDPLNVNIMKHSSLRQPDHDNWDPEEDRENVQQQRSTYPSAADPKDYKSENQKPSFLSFLSEISREGRVDAAIAQMQDEQDDELDPIAKRKIDQAEAKGDGKRAAMLRQQAQRRKAATTPNEPKSTTAKRVDQKKKELADALRRDKIEKGQEQ